MPHLLDTNELLLRAETSVVASRSGRGGSVVFKLQELGDAHVHNEELRKDKSG